MKARAVARLPQVGHWAQHVVGFSSQYNTGGWSAADALGPAGKIARCNSRDSGWWPSSSNAGREWIHVAFPQAVAFPRILVHENGTPGFVESITLYDAEGTGISYAVNDTLDHCPGPASFDLKTHPTPVIEVAVVIDTQRSNGWESIVAIQLVGYSRCRRERALVGSRRWTPWRGSGA